MAFTQGSATDIADLFSDLSTFLTSNGWTDRALTTGGSVGLAKTTATDPIEVQFRWDTGTPEYVGVYHSTGFTGVGTAPGNHTGDSGQGVVSGTNATIATGRHARLVNSTMPYWFFEGDHYAHVVVQVNAGPPPQLIHFGMGNLVKRGSYTGGAYAYGAKRSTVSSTATMIDGSILLDGLASGSGMTAFVASLHAEGLPNTVAAEEWLLVWADSTTANQGTDRNGDDRHFCQGGYRGGLSARFFARPSAQSVAGLIPMYPIPLFYRDLVPDPDRVTPLGEMPDVFGINVEHFNAGDEIVVGGDTYTLFPSWRNNGGAGNDTAYQGIAYKQVA